MRLEQRPEITCRKAEKPKEKKTGYLARKQAPAHTTILEGYIHIKPRESQVLLA